MFLAVVHGFDVLLVFLVVSLSCRSCLVSASNPVVYGVMFAVSLIWFGFVCCQAVDFAAFVFLRSVSLDV